ncbi:MAG: apolipoprotein N-acyltransferase, partial [Proteobacteria bacterium]|nr:apolipoprotein N-acyltransferase [Pseudomonadota bacterium]
AGWKRTTVGVAQGNIDQGVKWDESYRQHTLDIYARLSVEAKAQGARLVIWPETAVPFYLGERNPKEEIVARIVDNAGVAVLTGAPSYKYNVDTRGVEYLNSAYLFTPSSSLEKGSISGGGLAQKYDKVHLVPYGEYVPLKRFFPFIKKLTVGVGDFASGPGPVPIVSEEGPLGIIICYEAIFPKLSAGTVEAGAGLLVNITNDAWFGKSSAPYQHFEMALFRAVENRVTLLRSANTGMSAVVDPVGRVVERSGLFEEALIVEDVAIKEGGLTFYTRFPDKLAYLCLGVTLLALLYNFAIRRK